ncbi:MAG: hypothetical protein QW728_00505 [Thermoplasmata archaeon]
MKKRENKEKNGEFMADNITTIDEKEALEEARMMVERLEKRIKSIKEKGKDVSKAEAKLRLAKNYLQGANTRKVMALINEIDIELHRI